MHTNLRTIAEVSGVSLAAASYALRGSPKIPAATAERVRAVAKRLGYQGNPRIAELMAHIRGGRRGGPGDRLALLWTNTGGYHGHLRRDVLRGARVQAARRGYGIEEFVVGEGGLGAERMGAILQARGIIGVLLGPAQLGVRVEIQLPWERLAAVVIGAAEWSVPLSRAAHHHFEAMRLALAAARRHGSRVACWLDAMTDERAHRGWRGGWLAHGPMEAADHLMLAEPNAGESDMRRWLRSCRPQVVLCVNGHQARQLRSAGWRGPLLLLDRHRDDILPGVRQGYGSIAAHAVDLAVAQIQSSDFGPQRHPRTVLFGGTWESPPRGSEGPESPIEGLADAR